ncbi:MAG: shikimate kinase [Chlorobi bacterium]|nr:shikimate kinase [Chlorobiota bacterium]
MQNKYQHNSQTFPLRGDKRGAPPSLIYLIGFMGCGKSTLGRHLAKALGWKFIDLDDHFENKFRTTVPLFFKEFGERGFRDAERAALLDMENEEKAVVAAGGGTPCFFDNMDFMNRTGITIYMQVSPEELARRLSEARVVRPLVQGKTGEELLAYIREKLAEREPFYNKAKIIADASKLNLDGYLRILEGIRDF